LNDEKSFAVVVVKLFNVLGVLDSFGFVVID